MQRHTMTKIANHSKSNTLEWSVNTGGGGKDELKTILCGPLSSAVVHTRHLSSPREGFFLIHQCNISENRKIKRTQRSNNDEDSIARNNRNAEAKENQQVDFSGPGQSQSIRHQPICLSAYFRFIFDFLISVIRK